MPRIVVYAWSAITMPSDLTEQNIRNDIAANDPNIAGYDPARPSWVNQTYTYTGAPPIPVKIDDDDTVFEDGAVETGGAAVLRAPLTINGTTYPAGAPVENEFSLLDSGGNEVWVLRIAGENVGFTVPAGYPVIPAGVSFSPTQSRNAGGGAESSDGQSPNEAYSGIICIAADAMIATPEEPQPASALRPGDRVSTVDHAARAVLWRARFDICLAGPNDPRRPILIAPDALGKGRPGRALKLSPQHRVLLSHAGQDWLVPAGALTALPGIRVMRRVDSIGYVHVLCAAHEVIFADGLPVETLFPGAGTRAALPHGTRSELDAVLDGLGGYGPPARHCLTMRQARALARWLREAPAPAPAETPGMDRLVSAW